MKLNVTNLFERLTRLREPKAWSPKDWSNRCSYDKSFDDCFRSARKALILHKVDDAMGLADDGRSFDLMHRYLTLKLLQDEERPAIVSGSCDKGFSRRIMSIDADIKKYVEHFFTEDVQISRRIQLSVNYFHFLGTMGGARGECSLSYQQLEMWEAQYGDQEA